MNNGLPPDAPAVVLIAGPTASGKSALALALAALAPSVIINADASQVYRDLRVLSARPTLAEEARCDHRLFGHVDGATGYSTAAWAADATAAIDAAHAAGKRPILVGGTGLYIQTLLDGIAPIPAIDPEVRRAVRAMTISDAYAALLLSDAETAARLAPGDTQRIARALEVVRSTGTPFGVWHQRRTGGIAQRIRLVPLILTPPRDWLLARCDARFDAMLGNGAIAEVQALLARQLDPDLPVMRAIGVREVAAILGGDDPAAAADRAKLATRQFAKRQFTWFRNQPPDTWPRHLTTLSDDSAHQIAIKLHKTALTS